MSRYIANRLSEIRKHLGPRLEELKLQARVTKDKDSVYVEFVPKRSGGHRSPVVIAFANQDVTGLEEASWDQAELEVDVWGCRELGETGWVSWKQLNTVRHDMRGRDEKMFEWISFVLDYNGVIPPVMHAPRCIANWNFGDAFRVVARWADIEILQEYEYRNSPIEHLLFTDARGRDIDISIRMGDSHARVLVDGVEMESFPQHDLIRMNNTVRDLCSTHDFLPKCISY